jgi:DNA-binding NtrC family response regulator
MDKKILLVGDDFALLASRAAVLARTGANVTCCNSREFTQDLGRDGFGLVVVCHSLHGDTGCRIIKESNRRWPKARVIKVLGMDGKSVPCECHVDAVTDPEPKKLLEHVSGLLNYDSICV